MSSQSPDCLCIMWVGPDDGCHDVPEPIADMGIALVLFEPTRIAMSSPLITSNEPECSPSGMSMPDMFPGCGFVSVAFSGACMCPGFGEGAETAGVLVLRLTEGDGEG